MSPGRTLVFAVVAGLLWSEALRRLLRVWRTRSWPTARAVVVAIQRMAVQHDGNRPDSSVRAPLLRFWTAEHGQVEASADYWSTRPIAQVGEQVTVRYDPANPDRIYVVGMRRGGAAFLLSVLAAVPIFLALFVLLFPDR